MTSSPAPATPDEQYAVAFAGIQEVAARCDGARSLDLKGFDGQDTHYGRRIAAVPFERLTEDDKAEIARIALKYRQQILAYTGNDMSTLDVVLDAQGAGTNHTSRQNARRYEKLSAVQAARKVTLLTSGKVGVSWASKGDPDFSALVEAARKLPGREYNRATTTNEVDATPELLAFANEWDLEVPADVIAAVEARKAAVVAAPQVFNIGLLKGSNGTRLWIKADYNADRVAEARNLPGRRWNGGDKLDEVDAHPAVLAFAERWNLAISPKAQAAINDAGEEALDAAAPDATETRKLNTEGVLALASRAGSVTELPAEFVALVNRAIG